MMLNRRELFMNDPASEERKIMNGILNGPG